jgi:DNA-binding transcriptional ArsR family regulator
MKILEIILETGELNISEIARRSGLSHSSVARHLEFLVNSDLITEKRFNRIRIFRVDYSNPFIGALTRFISDWNKISATASAPRSFS